MHAPVVVRRTLASGLALLGALLLALPGRAADAQVVVLPATGIVDNVLAGYLDEGIRLAARDGAAAVVVRLNTPGGSLDATQRITSTLLEAPLPVIVWVAPSGGRAASAGTFITLAAHLAYMAPGTNIGAASPVGGGGEDIEGTLGQKVRNDAIANITAIAEARGRPVDWAVATVRDARSSSASEAVSLGAVDGLAADLAAVLADADGRTVAVRGAPVTLALGGSSPLERPMNPLQGLLHLLSDPNIAFVLFTVGTYGLIYEVINPNLATGIIGGLALILAFIGFGSLPLNLAGLLLIAFAVVLFVLEAQIVSHGLLAVAGVVAFALGASALYTEPGTPTGPAVEVALPLLVVMVGTTAVLMGLVTVAAARTREMRGSAGTVGVPVAAGAEGTVRAPLGPVGTAFVAGEEWTARTVDERPLARGTPVRLVGFDGLVALVEPLEHHVVHDGEAPGGTGAPVTTEGRAGPPDTAR